MMSQLNCNEIKEEPVEEMEPVEEICPWRNQRMGRCMTLVFPDTDDSLLYCEECGVEYPSDCPVHGPLLVVEDKEVPQDVRQNEDPNYCYLTLPEGLEIKPSETDNAGLGVFATIHFGVRSRFGPYKGTDEKNEDLAHASGYCWQIYQDGGMPSHFVDARYPCHSNWMRFVNCARREDEQCLTAYQHRGEIYYRAHRDIPPGTELLVYYGDSYAEELNIPIQRVGNFKCEAKTRPVGGKKRKTLTRTNTETSESEDIDFVDYGSDLENIEGGAANKFRWYWLEEKDSSGERIGDYVTKLAEPGIAYCLYCLERVNYSFAGSPALIRHASSRFHTEMKDAVLEAKHSLPLPASYQTAKTASSSLVEEDEEGVLSSGPSSSTTSSSSCKSSRAAPTNAIEISRQEAIVCSFIAENSLPLSMAPELVGLAHLLATDREALQSLAMEGQGEAACKLEFGLKEALRERLILKLRSGFFSINLEESATKHGAGEKPRILLLNILVCYFDFDVGKSVTQFYSCVELLPTGDDSFAAYYEAVMDTLKSDRIPFSNVISILCDTAASVRGRSNGFFAELKSAAPHLIAIDADVCHHIDMISKSFSACVDPDHYVAELMDDVFEDLESSADLREEFSSMCDLLNVKYVLPKERRAGHHWCVSLLDCCRCFDELKEVLCVFYYSWLSQEDTESFLFKVTVILIKEKVNKEGRQNVFGLLKKVRSRNVTDTARKSRISHKLFNLEQKTFLRVNIFLSVFPIFEKIVSLFERKTPMLHVLHDELVGAFRKFLQFFVRPEFIRKSETELHSLDSSREDILLPAAHVSVGRCSQVLLKMNDADVKSFRSTLLDAYLSTAIYMQNNLPLNNSLLRMFSFLDPKSFGKGVTAFALKELPKFLPTVDDVGNFDNEILAIESDKDISADDCGELDVWWGRVFKLNRYPSVTKIVSACLSVFTGQRVEHHRQSSSSPSLMDSALFENNESNSSSLLPATASSRTYEAYMFPKYHLLSEDSSTLKFYDREKNNVTGTSPVDSSLASYMQNAASRMSRDKN